MSFIVWYLLSVDWKLLKGQHTLYAMFFAYTWNQTEDLIHNGCSQGVCHTNVCKQKTKAQKHLKMYSRSSMHIAGFLPGLMTNILHSESAFYDAHGGAGLQLGDGGKRIRTSEPSLAMHRVWCQRGLHVTLSQKVREDWSRRRIWVQVSSFTWQLTTIYNSSFWGRTLFWHLVPGSLVAHKHKFRQKSHTHK